MELIYKVNCGGMAWYAANTDTKEAISNINQPISATNHSFPTIKLLIHTKKSVARLPPHWQCYSEQDYFHEYFAYERSKIVSSVECTCDKSGQAP